MYSALSEMGETKLEGKETNLICASSGYPKKTNFPQQRHPLKFLARYPPNHPVTTSTICESENCRGEMKLTPDPRIVVGKLFQKEEMQKESKKEEML